MCAVQDGTAAEVMSMRSVKAGQALGGRFELVRKLGEGGIGQVWFARERRLERDVAVKILLDLDGRGEDEERWKRGELLKRFAVEARAVAGLDHPGIPAVYDWSGGRPETGEPPYLAMQYIRGKDLGRVLAEETGGRLTVLEAVSLGAQLSSILAVLHGTGSGVFHRDLKPANIMVSETGRVSAIDFGSALIVAPHRPRVTTRSRTAPTTSGYTAPEIIQGRMGPVASSDLYALGCVIYRVLGGPVFGGEEEDEQSTRVLDIAHVKETPQPLRERNPDVPEELDRLVLQLLEKKPSSRPADAREAFARLRPFLPQALPEGIERATPYDLTLPFRDPCRPPERATRGEQRDRAMPPRTVTAARVDPTSFIEDLRRVGDLAGNGRREEAGDLLQRVVSAVESAQGPAGTDVRRALARGVRIFIELGDEERAKKLWKELIRRARDHGVDADDNFIREARDALRDYGARRSGE